MKLTTIEGSSNFLVALDVSTTPVKGDLISSAADLTEGQIVLLDDKNEVLDASTAGLATRGVRFCVKRKGLLRYSDVIPFGNMNFYSGADYAAATTQVTYFGYNGTAGSMDAATDTEYTIRLSDISDERLFPTKDMVNLAFYKSAAATQYDVATGMYKSLASNMNRGEDYVKVEMINSGTIATALVGTTLSVSHGGKTAVVTHATTAGTGIVAGMFLKIGTTTSSPIYEIESVTGAATAECVIVLVEPYAGVTANIAVAGAKTGTAAATKAGNFGFKFSSVSRSYFKPGVLSNLNFAFNLGYTGFTTATVTKSVVAYAGAGTYKQMAELEWYQEGHAGSVHRDEGVLDYFSMEYQIVSTGTYDQINIGFYDNDHHTAIGQNPASMKQLTIAFATPLTAGDSANVTVLAMDAFALASNSFAKAGIEA